MPIKTGMYMAAGNKSTCTVQGSVLLLTHGSMMSYYSILSLFSLLAIHNNFEEPRLRRYEPFLHILAFGWPLFLSIYGASKKFLNPSGPWCFVGRFPPRCRGSACHHDNIQGYIFLCLCLAVFWLLFATIMIISLYAYERRTQKRSLSLTGKKQLYEKFRKNKTRAIRQQTSLYVFSLYATFGLGTVVRSIQANLRTVHFPTIALVTVVVPFQGLLLAIVYEFTRLRQLNTAEKLAGDIGSKTGLHNTEIADIKLSIISNLNTRKEEEKKGNSINVKSLSYSIFDGQRRPSSVWAEFIFQDEDDSSSIGENIDNSCYNLDTDKSDLKEKQSESDEV